MLKMIDPAKAEEMEKQSNPPQFNVIKVSGPGCFTQTIFGHMLDQSSGKEDSVLILPKHFFYPASNQVRQEMTVENYEQMYGDDIPKNEVFTCHLWHASWQN